MEINILKIGLTKYNAPNKQSLAESSIRLERDTKQGAPTGLVCTAGVRTPEPYR